MPTDDPERYEDDASLAAISTREELELAMSRRICKNFNGIFGELIIRNDLWNEALEITMVLDRKVGFRASWAVNWAYYSEQAKGAQYLGRILHIYLASTNDSVLRSFGNIIYHALSKPANIDLFQPHLEKLAEKCFDLLINPSVQTAVKVWCMEILFELCPSVEWVNEYLPETIISEVEKYPSPAMQSHSRKVLRKLNNRKGKR